MVLVFLASPLSRAAAHGDVHARIDELTAELARSDADADLLFQRATQYTLDEDWDAAIRDFEAARKLNPANVEASLRIGEALLHLKQYDASLHELEAYMVQQSSDAEAYELRARAHALLGTIPQAVRDYDAAIQLAATPKPHLYVARSRLLAQAGQLTDALAGLEQGVARLGPLVSLIEPAIEAAVAHDRFVLAQAWVQRLPAAVRNSPRWHIRSADLALQRGNSAEARAMLEEGLRAIEQLPAARRESPAMVALRGQAERQLAGIAPERAQAAPRQPFARHSHRVLALASIAFVSFGLIWFARRRREANHP